MKRRETIKALVGASFAAMANAWQAEGVSQEVVDEARERRIKWFREAKFGMFIHWGLYAIPAGIWKGKEIPGIGEWIMFRVWRVGLLPDRKNFGTAGVVLSEWSPNKLDALKFIINYWLKPVAWLV